MKTHKSSAIIIRYLNYAETDRIVTFFSQEHGLLKGFARSARKSRKRFGTALEPFAETTLHWTESPGSGLVSLKEAELDNLRLGLRKDLEVISLAAYGCELIEGLMAEGQSHPQVFDLLQAFLNHLVQHDPTWEVRLLFELRLLSLAGYSPNFLHCSRCGGPLKEGNVFFDAPSGGSLCPQCSPAGAKLKVNLLTLGTLARSLCPPFTLFSGFRFSPRTIQEGNAVLKQAVSLHLPGPVRSLPMLDQMMSVQKPQESC